MHGSGCQSFATDERPAMRVSGGDREFDRTPSPQSGPTLAHGHVGRTSSAKRVEGAAVGLVVHADSLLPGKIGQILIVVLDIKIGNGFFHVPLETSRLVWAPQDTICENRQPGYQVIASALLKFLAKLWGPVLFASFIAVEFEIVKSLSNERAHSLDDLFCVAFKMNLGGLAAHLIAFQSLSSLNRRTILVPSGGMAKSVDRPDSLRRAPC